MFIISIISTRLLNNYFKADGFYYHTSTESNSGHGATSMDIRLLLCYYIISVYYAFLDQYFLEYFASVCFISDKVFVK